MKVETQKNRWFLSLIFGDVTCNPRIQIQETLGNKLNGLKPLNSCKKSFAFQKKLRKMLLHRRAKLSDQNKQPQEINVRVTYHT